MFKSIFRNGESEDGVEKSGFNEEEVQQNNVTRKATLRILNTQIIYDSDEGCFYSIATCINEDNAIETISLEGFSIERNLTELPGAYIDYEEFEEDGEEYTRGVIRVLSRR